MKMVVSRVYFNWFELQKQDSRVRAGGRRGESKKTGAGSARPGFFR
jgi:hypothetical protein